MIQQTATTLFQPGTVAELRILNTPRDGTVSGYFDALQPFVQAAELWSGKAPAVYATLNPCNAALLARAANRLKPRVKTTTSDTDILQRYWLPLDFDPERPADISSTDAEHTAALQRAEACAAWLRSRGWPAPVSADSGNGGHNLYRIDLPNDEASRALLQRCLEALALYFSDSAVALDLKVFNAARIWKVYGTLACKGDHVPERPHRLARLLDVPTSLEVVTRAQLEALAALIPEPPKAKSRQGHSGPAAFNLEQWIAEHGLPVVSHGAWNGGTKWVLNPCPWDSTHTNKAAFVMQLANGAIAAGCHHNGCVGHNWHALRDLYEPGGQTRSASPRATLTVNGPPRRARAGPDLTAEDPGDREGLLATVGDTEDLDGLAAGARQDDDTREPAVRYRATRYGLVWEKPTKDGPPIDVLLTNFTATLTAEITEDDGAETRKRFALAVTLKGQQHPIEIPAAQFAGMSWVTEHLSATAIVMPGMTLKDHTRAAIQLLSTTIDHRRVHTHLGWCKRGEVWYYLHAGGAIGPHGAVDDITVAPGQALSAYQLPAPPQSDNAREAIRRSLALLEVAPDAVTLPVHAALWRSALGHVDCSVHLTGPTGEGKSEIAALVQQHWGPAMDARHLPASWLSTGNALEGIAFQAKDAVLVVDDFCPTGGKADIARMHREADRLLRAQGNRSGRQRMRADSTLRPPKPPRGLILSTGEDIPRGQSLRARMLILDVAPGTMNWDKLTPCQNDAAAGVYACALAGFVQWLAPRYAEVVQGLPAELRALRQQALQDGHRRTPDIIANLALGMQYVMAYAHDCGALTIDECRTYWKRTWQALGDAAHAQHEHQASEDPVARFRALLSAALTAGLAHVADAGIRVDPPPIPQHWGWRGHEQRVGEDTTMLWQPLGACIGWLHGDRLYLDPDVAFSVVQRLAESQQAPLPLTQQTLWKRMHEQKILRREAAQQKNQVRRVIGGKTEYVIDISAYYVSQYLRQK
jgi:hypothetical protein